MLEEDDDGMAVNGRVDGSHVKVKLTHKKKAEFGDLHFVQDFTHHFGAIWCLRFSNCGNLLATAGSDTIIRVWIVKEREEYFNHIRAKYNNGANNERRRKKI